MQGQHGDGEVIPIKAVLCLLDRVYPVVFQYAVLAGNDFRWPGDLHHGVNLRAGNDRFPVTLIKNLKLCIQVDGDRRQLPAQGRPIGQLTDFQRTIVDHVCSSLVARDT